MTMRLLLVCLISTAAMFSPCAFSQSPSPSAAPKKPAKAKSSPNPLLGLDSTKTTGPITTEIYADEAFFDSAKSMGVFSGHVKVTDPRFNVQADKLTVFIAKGENQGLERAVAEGNVGVVRDRPDPNGGPPTHAVGRSEKAVYTSSTGDVELTGMPRVQQGLNTHVATSSETVMVINQNGQLTTHGPSRTDIRQEPKDETKDADKGEKDENKDGQKDEKKKEKKEKKENKKAEPTPKP